MLSVLIPVYNTDVRPFVKQLTVQMEKLGVPAEVICLDDASAPEWKMLNREMASWKFVVYEELEVNQGRSRIRNMLAEKARFAWLLFADGDSGIDRDDFLERYTGAATNPLQLVYGGTAYGPRPAVSNLYLHWLYGSQRECIPAGRRQQNRFGTFKTNNFIVSKQLFMQVKFDETVKGYGHEDTLFAKDLARKGFDILHIDNPLLHNGLETNVVFIEKQKNALLNLVKLYREKKLGDEIRLIHFYHTVKKWRLLWLVKRAYLKNEEGLMKNLLSDRPDLGSLDRLKMGWFLKGTRG